MSQPPPPQDSPLVVSQMDDIKAVLQGTSMPETASAAAGGLAVAEAEEEAGRSFFGWLLGGWQGYALTAVLATVVTGGGILALSMTDLAVGSFRQVSALPFSFDPDRLASRIQETYTDGLQGQANAFVVVAGRSAVQLTHLSQTQIAKVASVSGNIVAEAKQDKAKLVQLAQDTSKLASFKSSEDAKEVLQPVPKSGGPLPTPIGAPPPPGAPGAGSRNGDTVILGAAPARTPAPQPTSAATNVPAPTQPAATAAATQPAGTPAAQVTAGSTSVATIAAPTAAASTVPTVASTSAPTAAPTVAGTEAPTIAPTTAPTVAPTQQATPASTNPPATPAPPTATPVPPTATAVPPSPTPTALPLSISSSSAGRAVFTLGGMIPGDNLTRTITMTNNGGSSLTYVLNVSCTAGCSGPAGLLWTDGANGLQLTVARGSATLYSGAVQATNVDMQIRLAPTQSDPITLIIRLPTTAGNQFAGLSSTIQLTWTAVQ